jgi:pimeloyl-ACP methyl ester carboxylesterase
MRRIAHHLAHFGIASLRWDRRGFGVSGGSADEVDYDTDVEDAIACFRWLAARPEVDGARVAVSGHSAGALVTCRVCRQIPEVAGALFLGALASPIEDMLRWNVARVSHHWANFSSEQQAWLEREMPSQLMRAESVEVLLAAARRGDETVHLEGRGLALDVRTARIRQDLDTSYADEFRHVSCPALVLHGGDDLNVAVDNAHVAYRALRAAGNDEVDLLILAGLEHYFCPVSPDPALRIWERVSLEAIRRPMAAAALDAIAHWAARTLASVGPDR